MRADELRVVLEVRGAGVVVGRLVRIEIRGQRRLRVDDDLPAAGQLHDGRERPSSPSADCCSTKSQ